MQIHQGVPLRERMLAFIRESGDPVRPADVANHFGASPQYARNTLSVFAKRGLITRVGYGLYVGDMADEPRRNRVSRVIKVKDVPPWLEFVALIDRGPTEGRMVFHANVTDV